LGSPSGSLAQQESWGTHSTAPALFLDRAALAEARRLIEANGYGRRLPELQDTEATAAGW